jgi:hypothetical protein
MFMPERLHRQEKLRKLEDDRLRKLGLKTGDESISQAPYLMLSRQREAAPAANGTKGAGESVDGMVENGTSLTVG